MPDEPQRGGELFAGLDRRGPRRARARRRDGRRDRPGHRGRCCTRRGIAADIVPERSIAESLAADLISRGSPRTSACWSRGPPRRATCCREQLRDAGADVRDRGALRDRPRAARQTRAGAARRRRLRHLHQLLHGAVPARVDRRSRALPARARVVSIGPVTSDTARELGLEVHVEAAAPRRRRPRGRAAGATRWRRAGGRRAACCRSPSCPTTATATSSWASATA